MTAKAVGDPESDLWDAPFGGVEGGGTCTRPWEETGKGSSSRGETPRKLGLGPVQARTRLGV
jgi:hypothetical protein